MKPVSLLTQGLRADTDTYNQAVHNLQQLNRPAPQAEQIRAITLSYQSRPSQKNDGKDWARQILDNQGRHHAMAIKWAKQVLSDELKQPGGRHAA